MLIIKLIIVNLKMKILIEFNTYSKHFEYYLLKKFSL